MKKYLLVELPAMIAIIWTIGLLAHTFTTN